MHVRDPAAVRRLADRVPVLYYVFDVLYVDGESLLQLPYTERRGRLEDLDLGTATWRVPPSFRGPAADVMAASAEHGLEGIVAKRQASTYRPGQRSPDWRKVKHQRMQEVVIAGWRPGKGRRTNRIGSLILAVPDQHGELQHVGGVGTGFTERMLDHLAALLAPLRQDTSPFPTPLPRADTRHALWVRPELVGEVAYTEWTGDGHLRHPSWRGLRPDKRPEVVHREESQ
jgi:bifunctional non-homologous end joining protein LigD